MLSRPGQPRPNCVFLVPGTGLRPIADEVTKTHLTSAWNTGYPWKGEILNNVVCGSCMVPFCVVGVRVQPVDSLGQTTSALCAPSVFKSKLEND